MDRIERLLRLGFLPSQVPPPFTTADLAAHHAPLYAAWLSQQKPPPKGKLIPKAPPTKTELFSVVRAGLLRRATSLPNPISQTYLSTALISNWHAIVRHYRRSKLSVSRPRFRRDSKRAASLPSMQTLYERRLLKGAGFRFVLRTDISRFFPTIYTHSIPWALHGKTDAKKHRNVTPKYFGNLLDMAVRQCQDEQTFGLPIGPDTSHIIAECIATALDIELFKRIRGGVPGFRYVDDYYLFFGTYAAAEAALSHIAQCLKEYELQINFEKTTICRTEDLEEDSWTHILRSFNISNGGQRQRTEVNHYFEIARDLARRNRDESVMIYALRRVSSVIIRTEHWAPFEAQLCLVAAAHPVTLQTVARILSTYAHLGYPIDKLRLSRLVNSLIFEHAPLEHHSEVAWCVWMCKDLGLTLSTDNVALVADVNSSICTLMLLDIAAARGISKWPAPARWKQFERPEALWEDFWMLSYEAGVRGWGGMSDTHVKANPYFDELRKLNIHFYDETATLPPIFTPKADAFQQHNVQTIAQLLELEDLHEAFEYEDDEDVYGSPIESEGDADEF